MGPPGSIWLYITQTLIAKTKKVTNILAINFIFLVHSFFLTCYFFLIFVLLNEALLRQQENISMVHLYMHLLLVEINVSNNYEFKKLTMSNGKRSVILQFHILACICEVCCILCWYLYTYTSVVIHLSVLTTYINCCTKPIFSFFIYQLNCLLIINNSVW